MGVPCFLCDPGWETLHQLLRGERKKGAKRRRPNSGPNRGLACRNLDEWSPWSEGISTIKGVHNPMMKGPYCTNTASTVETEHVCERRGKNTQSVQMDLFFVLSIKKKPSKFACCHRYLSDYTCLFSLPFGR